MKEKTGIVQARSWNEREETAKNRNELCSNKKQYKKKIQKKLIEGIRGSISVRDLRDLRDDE